jgi:predicted ATPase with chaperone activity
VRSEHFEIEPGEVSLSHHGVLFLDELPEFNRDALEVLRQPLEDGMVNVSRVSASYTYPADFTLAAMNPCPCGYFGDVYRQCARTSTQVQKYQKRISGRFQRDFRKATRSASSCGVQSGLLVSCEGRWYSASNCSNVEMALVCR